MGVPLEQVLGSLSLSYSAPPDEDENESKKAQYQEQVWTMLIEMGERLLSVSSAPPVRTICVCLIQSRLIRVVAS